jgi:hypothetical protein
MQANFSAEMRDLLPRADAEVLSTDVYNRAGLFVLRRGVPASTVSNWQRAWQEFAQQFVQRKVDPFNPVVVHEDMPNVLADIHRDPAILDVMAQVYPDLALYQQRFVIKDAQSRTPVFIHQDFGYDHGWPEKTALFIPLSTANEDNGGLRLYPGTHRMGYLGDTGEINVGIIDPDWPWVCPSLEPGDLLLMHECTWHGSGPHVRGVDRILVQATFQPASDPTGVALLRGKSDAPFNVGALPREDIFIRSRASRLRELQSQVNQFNGGNMPT